MCLFNHFWIESRRALMLSIQDTYYGIHNIRDATVKVQYGPYLSIWTTVLAGVLCIKRTRGVVVVFFFVFSPKIIFLISLSAKTEFNNRTQLYDCTEQYNTSLFLALQTDKHRETHTPPITVVEAQQWLDINLRGWAFTCLDRHTHIVACKAV